MDELTALKRKIDRTPNSPTKVALLEQAIQLVDSMNDLDGGFRLRRILAQAANFSGFPEKMLVAFSWNLAQVDRDPERFSESEILWTYKWAISSFIQFPQISRNQCESALADLTRRYERLGASLRPIHKLRASMGIHMGDREMVALALPLWKKAKRDEHSDCKACDQNTLISSELFVGHDRRAMQIARPILENRMTCSEVPHTTYSQVLLSLVRLGRVDEAAEYHRRGLELVRGNLNFVSEIADHLVYLLLVEDVAGAVRLFERHTSLALETNRLMDRYLFWRGAIFLMRKVRKARRSKRKFRLPSVFPLWNQSGAYDATELQMWFETEAGELAKRFDARAGNTFCSDQLNELDRLEDLIQTGHKDGMEA